MAEKDMSVLTFPNGKSYNIADKEARKQIALMGGLPEGSTTMDQWVNDIRVGEKGEEYDSPGEAVRRQVGNLRMNLVTKKEDATEDTQIAFEVVDDDGNELNKIKQDLDTNYLYNNLWQISGNLIDKYLPDLNTIEGFSKSFHFVPTASKRPLNMPSDTKNDDYYCLIQLAADIPAGGLSFQLLSNSTNLWLRYKKNTTEWNAWTLIASKECIENSMKVFRGLVTSDTYMSIIPDANSIKDNGMYLLNVVSNGNVPSGLPWKKAPYGSIFAIVTLSNLNSVQNVGARQYVFGDGERWERTKGASWNTWTHIEEKRLFTVGAEGCDYTELVPAILEARKRRNGYVLVKDGTYDFITEIKKYIASDFFDNWEYAKNDYAGIMLYNGITIEMSSQAKILCHYTGSNASVRSSFTPLQASHGDFTLINVTMECSNVRYCVHDDNLYKSVEPCHHKYVNCHFTLDNRDMQGNPDTMACIGGGLDYDEYVEVIGCYFDSKGSQTRNPYTDKRHGVVGFHNTNEQNAKSHISIRDCYCETGTFMFGKYGDTTKITNVEVSNCVVNAEPYVYWESASQYQVDNMKLRAWSNVIKQN